MVPMFMCGFARENFCTTGSAYPLRNTDKKSMSTLNATWPDAPLTEVYAIPREVCL